MAIIGTAIAVGGATLAIGPILAVVAVGFSLTVLLEGGRLALRSHGKGDCRLG